MGRETGEVGRSVVTVSDAVYMASRTGGVGVRICTLYRQRDMRGESCF